MSNPTDPGPALRPQTVRILTPVHDFKIEGADSFSHAGLYKGADFKVVLRPYAGPADRDALVNLAHANNRASIRQGFRRFDAGAAGCHVLLIEVALPGSAHALDTGIATEVQLSTVEALRLHSTAGLPHDDPLMFSDVLEGRDGERQQAGATDWAAAGSSDEEGLHGHPAGVQRRRRFVLENQESDRTRRPQLEPCDRGEQVPKPSKLSGGGNRQAAGPAAWLARLHQGLLRCNHPADGKQVLQPPERLSLPVEPQRWSRIMPGP